MLPFFVSEMGVRSFFVFLSFVQRNRLSVLAEAEPHASRIIGGDSEPFVLRWSPAASWVSFLQDENSCLSISVGNASTVGPILARALFFLVLHGAGRREIWAMCMCMSFDSLQRSFTQVPRCM